MQEHNGRNICISPHNVELYKLLRQVKVFSHKQELWTGLWSQDTHLKSHLHYIFHIILTELETVLCFFIGGSIAGSDVDCHSESHQSLVSSYWGSQACLSGDTAELTVVFQLKMGPSWTRSLWSERVLYFIRVWMEQICSCFKDVLQPHFSQISWDCSSPTH